MEYVELRRYPRVRSPKGLVVAWQSGTRRTVSYLESLALGGLFVLTRQPVPLRSMVKILLNFQLVRYERGPWFGASSRSAAWASNSSP